MTTRIALPDLAKLASRDEFGAWLNAFGLVGEGAEIGCAFGGNSSKILAKWKGRKLIMVDPWERQPSDVYREHTDSVDYEAWYTDCLRLAERDKRVEIRRGYSVEVAKTIPDLSLDFAYIDGNHAYRPVLEDMDAWWPKIKWGGVMGGHDFYNDTNQPHFCEVKMAVERWCREHDCRITVTPCTSWWVVRDHR